MKKGNVIRITVVVLILALLAVGYYIIISKRDNGKGKEEEAKVLDDEKLLKTDLEKDYPPTPTSVISYYSDLLLAYYNDDCTQEMRKELMVQSRLMYDDELLDINEEDEQLLHLEADTESYQKDKKQIINYTVCEQDEVRYGDLDKDKVATVAVSYRIREKDKLRNLEEEYFLRKDSEDKWKILGWQLKGNSKK